MRSRVIVFALLAAACLASPAAAEQAPRKQVLVLVGLPGSGKSTAGEMIGELVGGAPLFKSGDLIRARVKSLGQASTPENDRAAAEWFAERPGAIGEGVASWVRGQPGDFVMVDGIRNPADMAILGQHFDVKVLSLDVPEAERFRRMQARGRFDNETTAYYQERDAREKALGVEQIMKRADYTVRGSHTLEGLRRELAKAVKSLKVRPAVAAPKKKAVARQSAVKKQRPAAKRPAATKRPPAQRAPKRAPVRQATKPPVKAATH